MPIDPRMLLRGFAKLVAVVVVAGLAGALLGIGLAKLSGNDGGGAARVAPLSATTATPSRTSTIPATPATQTQPPQTSTAAGETAAAPAGITPDRQPSVKVLSAQLRSPTGQAGRATVTVRVRVTNRGAGPLEAPAPALLTGHDVVPIDPGSQAGASSLLRPLAPGASATGVLRFTSSGAVTRHLQARSNARLSIAKRIVALKLAKQSA